MRNPARLLGVARRLGFRDVAFYALYQAQLRSGWLRRRLPVREWEKLPEEWIRAARSPFSRPDRARIVATCGDPEGVVAAARRIIGGELLYFSRHWLKRSDWSGGSEHFSKTAIPANVKWEWEPARFDWVYTLVRAWGVTGDEEYLQAAVKLVLEWRAANPPNRGLHWNNTQECAIRLFAVVFLAGMVDVAALWEITVALALRIEQSLSYSRAQRNNHLLAEAAALHLAGWCVPAHPRSRIWVRKGRRLMIAGIVDQFAPDGSYILHSMNYAREALRDVFVFMKTTSDVPLEVAQRVAGAARFLYEVQDESGRVPNYGHNDGSNYMSLSSAAYGDFRPIVQTISMLIDGATPYEAGAQDEESVWFFAAEPRRVPRPRQQDFRADDGGYYVLRRPSAWAMIRCHTFRTRPSHSDMLHFDFWRDGVNALCDSGTFQYGDPEGRNLLLESVFAHNTVVINDADPMTKAGPFLWADWTKSKLLSFERGKWSGEHYGYARFGVTHRRTVHASGDGWLIIDDLLCDPTTSFTAALRWHVDPAAKDAGIHVIGGAERKSGEMSRYYGELEPVHVLERRETSTGPLRFYTVIGNVETWKDLLP